MSARWSTLPALALAVVLGAAAPAGSAKPTPAAVAPTKGKAKEPIREGAFLRKDLPLDRRVDLRGAYERARDAALTAHYERLAELDWIEQLAVKADDTRLVERVEAVRRKERRRFDDVMNELWQQWRSRSVVGFP